MHWGACAGGQIQGVMALDELKFDWSTAVSYMQIGSDWLHKVTLLHVAASLPSNTILEYMMDNNHVIDINAVTDDGRTALWIAVWLKRFDNVISLLKAGANGTITESKFSESPSHIAAKHGDVQVISALLEHGCDSSVVDISGLTPALRAEACGHATAASMLAGHAAEPGQSLSFDLGKFA